MSNKLTLSQLIATTEALRALARPVGGDIPEQQQRLGVGPTEIIDRARLYLKTIPGAVSGQGGHNRTFFVANRLVRGFDIRPAAALPLFQEWNEKCVPPWPDAELERKLAEADRQPGPRGFLLATSRPVGTAAAHTVGADGNPAPVFRNFVWDEIPDGNTMKRVKVGRTGERMLEELVAFTGGWPRRCGRMLFAVDLAGDILWMIRAPELLAWIDHQYGKGNGAGYEWAGGMDCLSAEVFLQTCRSQCENWNQVELHPHEPTIPGHYYHHPDVPAGDGKHLTELVRQFSPATPLDEDLIRLLFLSMVWGGQPGKRPLFVIESVEGSEAGGRGAGKTTLATMAASLVGGYLSISPNEALKDIHSRLLSPEGMSRRVGLIDNLKSMRFSNADLEGMVTAEVISGKQMYTGEGRRPNTLTWIITSNMPSLSKDLSQRAVIIQVARPVYDPKWQKRVAEYIDKNRWAIIGDCIAELRQVGHQPPGYRFLRWSEWEEAVLFKAPEPEKIQAAIAERQRKLDDDADTTEDIAEFMADWLRKKGFDPDTEAVLIPSNVLYEEVVLKYAPKLSRTGGVRWLYHVGISCLSKWHSDKPFRGGLWFNGQWKMSIGYKEWSDGWKVPE